MTKNPKPAMILLLLSIAGGGIVKVTNSPRAEAIRAVDVVQLTNSKTHPEPAGSVSGHPCPSR